MEVLIARGLREKYIQYRFWKLEEGARAVGAGIENEI